MSFILDVFGNGTGLTQPSQPATPPSVPENLVGATSRVQLQLIEDTMTTFRSWEVSVNQQRIPGQFDAKHLRALHAWLLQDMYPDVGGTRTDELNYELREQQRNPVYVMTPMATQRLGLGGETIPLLPARDVNAQLSQLATQLAAENYLMGFDKPAFVERLAVYYLHYARVEPFTEGSSVVLATMFVLLGREAGYEVSLSPGSELRRLTDALLANNFAGGRQELERVLASVTTEEEGPEAALRRKITMQVVRPQNAPQW